MKAQKSSLSRIFSNFFIFVNAQFFVVMKKQNVDLLILSSCMNLEIEEHMEVMSSSSNKDQNYEVLLYLLFDRALAKERRAAKERDECLYLSPTSFMLQVVENLLCFSNTVENELNEWWLSNKISKKYIYSLFSFQSQNRIESKEQTSCMKSEVKLRSRYLQVKIVAKNFKSYAQMVHMVQKIREIRSKSE